MPVRRYRVRYVVLKMESIPLENYKRLIELMGEECEKHQPGFRFKAVYKSKGIIVFKCPHKAVPFLRILINRLSNTQPFLGVEIIGVSGTLRKSFSKFCLKKDSSIEQGKDYKALVKRYPGRSYDTRL